MPILHSYQNDRFLTIHPNNPSTQQQVVNETLDFAKHSRKKNKMMRCEVAVLFQTTNICDCRDIFVFCRCGKILNTKMKVQHDSEMLKMPLSHYYR